MPVQGSAGFQHLLNDERTHIAGATTRREQARLVALQPASCGAFVNFGTNSAGVLNYAELERNVHLVTRWQRRRVAREGAVDNVSSSRPQHHAADGCHT